MRFSQLISEQNIPLTEGGNAIPDSTAVNREDVFSVVETAKKALPKELLKSMQVDIGSAGFKTVPAGDIDLMIEAGDLVAVFHTEADKKDPVLAAKKALEKYFTDKGMQAKVNGRNVSVGIVYQEKASRSKRLAQVDYMVIHDAAIVAPYHQHGPRGMYDDPNFIGNAIFIVMNSIGKATVDPALWPQGLKFDAFGGKLMRRDNNEVVARNRAEVAKILFGPAADESALDSVKNMVAALRNDPRKEEKLAQARVDADKGIIPALPESIDLRWLNRLTESLEKKYSLQEAVSATPNIELKQRVITGVKQTNDEKLLQKILQVLHSTDLGTQLTAALSTDVDIKNMLENVARVVLETEGTLEEKQEFIANFPKGFINIKKIFGLKAGKVTYDEVVTSGFPKRVFNNFVVAGDLNPRGVGAGELALSIMSPKITFHGKVGGGGDILVAGVGKVEVKTAISDGGRWHNAREAGYNMKGVGDMLEKAVSKTLPNGKVVPGPPLPKQIRIQDWVDIWKPEIKQGQHKKDFNNICRYMADALFSNIDNTAYANALQNGNAEEIREAILSLGFNNYKSYANWDGILIIDNPRQILQYFRDYESMKGHIHVGTTYVYAADQGILMPQVRITKI
jgi:hypothetical protein